MMAAARARRGLAFFTFMDDKLKEELEKIYKLLVREEVTVGEMFCTFSRSFNSPELFDTCQISKLSKYVLQANCLKS